MIDGSVVEYADEGAVVKVSVEDGGEVQGDVTATSSVGESHIIHIGEVTVESGVGYIVHKLPDTVMPAVHFARSDGSLKPLGKAEVVELLKDSPEGPEGPRGAV
jgi:hypothetical protein